MRSGPIFGGRNQPSTVSSVPLGGAGLVAPSQEIRLDIGTTTLMGGTEVALVALTDTRTGRSLRCTLNLDSTYTAGHILTELATKLDPNSGNELMPVKLEAETP